VQFAIDDPPLLLEVNNGLRTLMLLSPHDLSASWNQYNVRAGQRDFQLGCNIYAYATDKTSFRSRLETPHIEPRQVQITRTIRVARIQYAGNWDVEPFGWARLGHYMNNECATRLLVSSGVTLDSPALAEFKVAHISGTSGFELSADEQAGLRRFLNDGGTLLADAAGGSTEFAAALERHITAALKADPTYLGKDDPVLSAAGLDGAIQLSGMTYRRAARSEGQTATWPRLKTWDVGRRYAAFLSLLDIGSGLLGGEAYNCRGYEDRSALRIMRNLLLYANLSTAEKSQLHGRN
jgi:hypothetical protein